MTAPVLWLARDGDGRLFWFEAEPTWVEGLSQFDWETPVMGNLPDSIYPELLPGQKVRASLTVVAR